MHWSFNKRDAILFNLIGLCTSLVVAGGLILIAHKIVKYKMDDDNLPYVWYQVGIDYRVWYEADEDWPWNDRVPSDAEAVSGTWIGLPFPAVRRRINYPHYDPVKIRFIRYSPRYVKHTEFRRDLHLYRPHWFGLFANTFFWGSLAWFIRCLWRTIIAHTRLRRGYCAFCNYNQTGLQESESCPECGKE